MSTINKTPLEDITGNRKRVTLSILEVYDYIEETRGIMVDRDHPSNSISTYDGKGGINDGLHYGSKLIFNISVLD